MDSVVTSYYPTPFLPWGFNKAELVVSIVLLLLLPVILYYIVKYLIPKTEPAIIPKKKVDTKTKEKFKPENVVGFKNIIKSSNNILIIGVLGAIVFVVLVKYQQHLWINIDSIAINFF